MYKIIYCYDGTFGGLLTAFSEIRESAGTPEDITTGATGANGLFSEAIVIETDYDRAAALAGEITACISSSALTIAYHAFLAEVPGSEMLIYSYLELGLEVGRKLDSMLAHERVASVLRLARKTVREAHRMKGFVRFREVRGGIYYAELEPDHHILPLIARHFAHRFRDQNWVIHDLKRGMAIIHQSAHREWDLLEISVDTAPEPAERELDFQRLWRTYFEHISVGQRCNHRLQRSRLPLKYRRHLVEL